ncbi:MAG TPA: cupin domain-containing protein [Burkholderiales bacterium]|nr:cupin domain-containing protein [Burkholderiales bacterium]
MKTSIAVIGIALATTAGVAVMSYAQQPGFTRKMLQDQTMSISDRHAVQVLAEFIPGGAAGRHTHPGEELGYILEGTLQLEVDGQPPRTLKAGEVFFIPAGTVHDGKNVGSGPAKVLATYVVEKGKPVASPAK